MICAECTSSEHEPPLHSFDKLSTVSVRERQKIENLIIETKQKLNEYMQVNADLENALTELQVQHDNAKDLINETFQVGFLLLFNIYSENPCSYNS